MTMVPERMKMMREMMDEWTNREKLALATAVSRSGDQNWSSVSRFVRPYASYRRPADWFSPKNCALQYAVLLESVDTPKRTKRAAGLAQRNLQTKILGSTGERVEVETPVECLVKRLTEIRRNELKKEMAELRESYMEDAEIIGDCYGDEMDQETLTRRLKYFDDFTAKQKAIEESYDRRLAERDERRKKFELMWKPAAHNLNIFRRHSSVSEASSDTADSPINEPLNVEVTAEESVSAAKTAATPTPTSPLLTSLLKSPSTSTTSILHSAITSPLRGSSPTIANLLSSPSAASVIPSQINLASTSVSPNLKNLVSTAIGSFTEETKTVPTSPSQGAPTLSMLLELPPSLPGKPLPVLQTPTPPPPPPPPPPSQSPSTSSPLQLSTPATPVTAPPPYSEHLGPPPPYSLATEYLQKQKAKQQQQQELLLQAVVNFDEPKDIQVIEEVANETHEELEAEVVIETNNVQKSHGSPIKEIVEDEKNDGLVEEEEILVKNPQPVIFDREIISIVDDHNYVEKTPEKEKYIAAVSIVANKHLDTSRRYHKIDVFEFDETTESSETDLSSFKSRRTPRRVSNGDPTTPTQNANVNSTLSNTVIDDKIIAEDEEIILIEDDKRGIVEEKETEKKDDDPKIIAVVEKSVENEEIEVVKESGEAEDDCLPIGEERTGDRPIVLLEKLEKTDVSTTEDERSNDGLPGHLRKRKQRLTTSLSASDSVPGSPNSTATLDDEKDYRVWKKSALLVLSRLNSHKSSSLFAKPITDDQALGYTSIIFRPMDLSTIKKNIESGAIRTTVEFQRDVMLMFRNAIMFNKRDELVYQMTEEMERECPEYFQMLRLATSTDQSQPSRRETRTNQHLATHDKSSTRISGKNTRLSSAVANERRKRSSNISSTETGSARKKPKLED